MDYRSFWYVIAESEELKAQTLLGRKVLGEWLAVFRGEDGQAVAMRDRCMHRNAPLSKGHVENGQVSCPYHGWRYDAEGTVTAVPAEGAAFKASKRRCAVTFPVIEQDGFVYVRLERDGPSDILPFKMPHRDNPAWRHLVLVNRFRNSVTNCAENFIDVPHTVYVHPGIFRDERRQRIETVIRRENGSVLVDYQGETDNVGWFARFLNPDGTPLVHRDNFHMPNVTEVEYRFSRNRHLFIISQSVPEEDDSTLVYTTLSYNFGAFSRLGPIDRIARRILAFQAQRVIDQDIEALDRQMAVIERYGEDFNNTSADAIHVFVESIRDALLQGQDPRTLPTKTARVGFYV